METARHWRLSPQRYSLVGEVCPRCDARIFPPRDLCPECGEEAREAYKFSGRGEIYSFTTVSDAPAEFSEFTPYAVALIRLEEGPLLTAQVTDLDGAPLRIGMPVEMVTRKLHSEGEKGTLVYGYKFRPVLERAS